MTKRHKNLVLIALILAMMATLAAMPIDQAQLLEWGAAIAKHPLAIVAVVALMAALMSIGLPGSVCFWLIAPFHAPWLATLMLVAGSSTGAFGAYKLGTRLGDGWQPRRASRHVLRLLHERGDFPTQMALRVLPGFPHAVVNIAAGVLGLRLWIFLLAAVVGLSVKWGVYTSAVHGVRSAQASGSLLDASVMLPLLVLTALLITGGVIRYQVEKRQQKRRENLTP